MMIPDLLQLNAHGTPYTCPRNIQNWCHCLNSWFVKCMRVPASTINILYSTWFVAYKCKEESSSYIAVVFYYKDKMLSDYLISEYPPKFSNSTQNFKSNGTAPIECNKRSDIGTSQDFWFWRLYNQSKIDSQGTSATRSVSLCLCGWEP